MIKSPSTLKCTISPNLITALCSHTPLKISLSPFESFDFVTGNPPTQYKPSPPSTFLTAAIFFDSNSHKHPSSNLHWLQGYSTSMEMKQLFLQFSLFLLFIVHLNTIVAQSPAAAPSVPTAPTISPPAPVVPRTPAPAPGPAGPTDITAILTKIGHFNTIIRLLKSTQTANRINDQLSNSRGGLTVFAPTDAAFSSMKNISLNTLSSQQQSELVQFHILPNYYSLSQFETASDPLSTQAGGTNYGQFPLNVTATGNSVNLTTGFSKASVSSTVYTDGQLAVYELDHVLLPQRFFITPPPVPAPAPAPPKHKKPAAKSDDTAPLNTSDAIPLCQKMFQASYVVALLAACVLCL